VNPRRVFARLAVVTTLILSFVGGVSTQRAGADYTYCASSAVNSQGATLVPGTTYVYIYTVVAFGVSQSMELTSVADTGLDSWAVAWQSASPTSLLWTFRYNRNPPGYSAYGWALVHWC
jgi:hypothetical protein